MTATLSRSGSPASSSTPSRDNDEAPTRPAETPEGIPNQSMPEEPIPEEASNDNSPAAHSESPFGLKPDSHFDNEGGEYE